jgi:hypothetical protein
MTSKFKPRVGAVALVALLACAGAKSPAEKSARGFMDAYYVNADLQQAERFADGLALEKVSDGLTLRDGLSIDEAAHHPTVHYRLADERVASDEAEFIYDVEFHPEKAQVFHRKTRLVVRLRNGTEWKVTQFSDHDPL